MFFSLVNLRKIARKSLGELCGEFFPRILGLVSPTPLMECVEGAAQKGGAVILHFAVLRTLVSCTKMRVFYLKTCTPMKGTPEALLDPPEKLPPRFTPNSAAALRFLKIVLLSRPAYGADW